MSVYLAGPINGCTDAEATDWRAEATALLDGDVIDPMSRDYRGVETENFRELVDADLADIRRATTVLVYAHRPSWGTAMEVRYAWSIGIPVVIVAPDPASPWLRYHCDGRLYPTVAAACEALA